MRIRVNHGRAHVAKDTFMREVSWLSGGTMEKSTVTLVPLSMWLTSRVASTVRQTHINCLVSLSVASFPGTRHEGLGMRLLSVTTVCDNDLLCTGTMLTAPFLSLASSKFTRYILCWADGQQCQKDVALASQSKNSHPIICLYTCTHPAQWVTLYNI